MPRIITTFLIALLLCVCLAESSAAQSKSERLTKQLRERNRVATQADCPAPVATADLDINNVRARLYNNGALFWRGGQHVYNVPKRETNQQHAIFASGLWIAGMKDGELHMTASDYGPWEYWPGPLDENGQPGQDCDSYDRMFKVSRQDIADYDENPSLATSDLLDWPYQWGAPVFDRDGIEGNYNLAGGDRPDIFGDQSIWWIMNDVGPHNWSQSPPLGIEVQVMAFAWDRIPQLQNTTFYRYRIHNKSGIEYNDAYISIWADPDLGDPTNDYTGSDPDRYIGYAWNGVDDDGIGGGYGTRPPAIGYGLLYGPRVHRDGVDNDDDGEIDEDDERLGMGSYITTFSGATVQGGPTNAMDAYRSMQGKWRDGRPITQGGSGLGFSDIQVKYTYPGNPPDFWSEENIDGQGNRNAPSDRKFVMSMGPFTLDSLVQEISFVIAWGQGRDRFESVDEMKYGIILARVGHFGVYPTLSNMELDVTNYNSQVLLSWNSGESSGNNYLDSYDEENPFLHQLEVEDKTYTQEGYKIFQFQDENYREDEAELIATFDVENGVTRVQDEGFESGSPISIISAEGIDSGLQHSMLIDGLTNGKDYFYGARPYAYNEHSTPKVLDGPIETIRVRPGSTTALNGGSDYDTNLWGHEIIGEELSDNNSDLLFSAKIVDPKSVTGDDYLFATESYQYTDRWNETFDVPSYNIINQSSGDTLANGRRLFENSRAAIRTGKDILVQDGLAFNVEGNIEESARFLLSTSNLAPVRGDLEIARQALDDIGITPNPYKASSAYEQNYYQDVARFLNLPESASIKVFDLSGTLVRAMEKQSPGTTFDWDLRNDYNLPIGSGVYMIHIDVPGVGERILKFGVVKKQILGG